MWCSDPTYRHMVEATWDGLGMPRDLRELTTHLGTMSRALQGWEQSTFGSVRQELCTLRHELEEVRGASLHSGPTRRERQLTSKMSELLMREEIMEKQRSWIEWLK